MKRIIQIVFIMAALGAGAVYYQANQILNIVNRNSLHCKPIYKGSPEKLTEKVKAKKSVNFLLLGVDTGALNRHFKGRSDTIMLLSINPKTKKSLLISIPRDMGSVMPGQANAGLAKTNTAYELGGPQTMRKVLKQHYNIPIDGYAIVNMGGLEDLLAAVHGVRVKSNLTFTQDWYHFKKGHYYRLHGKKALAYIRERHEDPLGDYGRQIRQRQVLKALMKKIMKPKVLMNKKAINKITKHVKTDVTKKDVIPLGINYASALKHMKAGHAQGSSKDVWNLNYGLMEVENMSPQEDRRVTNLIKKNMKE